jgi:hypothetical protein
MKSDWKTIWMYVLILSFCNVCDGSIDNIPQNEAPLKHSSLHINHDSSTSSNILSPNRKILQNHKSIFKTSKLFKKQVMTINDLNKRREKYYNIQKFNYNHSECKIRITNSTMKSCYNIVKNNEIGLLLGRRNENKSIDNHNCNTVDVYTVLELTNNINSTINIISNITNSMEDIINNIVDLTTKLNLHIIGIAVGRGTNNTMETFSSYHLYIWNSILPILSKNIPHINNISNFYVLRYLYMYIYVHSI